MNPLSTNTLRDAIRRAGTLAIVGALLLGCSSATEPVSPRFSTAPAFSATVTMAERESGLGPAGAYNQINVWLAIPPGTDPNAGIIVLDATPVYVTTGASFYASSASAIKSGDRVQVWHDDEVAYGAVQSPPGSPAYRAVQVVIVR
jgi:hypothetical protein